jgi:hypothetical protein
MQPIPGRFADVPNKSRSRIGALFDDRTVATFDPHTVPVENPAIVRVTIKPLQDHARLSCIDRSCGPMMAGKTLQVEEPPGEVERHIDGAHGLPAIHAAVGGDHGFEQLAHLSVSQLPQGRPSQPWPGPLSCCTRTSRHGLVPALERNAVVGNGHGEGFRREVDRD